MVQEGIFVLQQKLTAIAPCKSNPRQPFIHIAYIILIDFVFFNSHYYFGSIRPASGLSPLSSTNISGDRALIQSQSKKCPQKHGGFLPKIRHFDVTVMAQTTDQTAIHK